MRYIQIRPEDNVGIALTDLPCGETVSFGTITVILTQDISRGHKFALTPIGINENIIKYGEPIGHATEEIPAGSWVHTYNTKTNLNELLEYRYEPDFTPIVPSAEDTFMGYPRAKGNPGVRNEVWIVATVGCVNAIAQRLADQYNAKTPENVDGVYAYTHPYGCSQLGEDHHNTQLALAGLVNHPNAGAVLVLGLGCENNNITEFKKVLGEYDSQRVKFLSVQDAMDEYEEAGNLLDELCEYANQFHRQPCSVSGLVVGLKCGGSDGLSGITANPLVGRFSDILISKGGSTILTEVPEMFGAETLLMKRAINEQVFDETVAMINEFKEYFQRNNQPIYENPSPGNKAGGITTLEDKSLGCTQKGGTAPVVDVLRYGEHVKQKGLSLLNAPGNDIVAATALAVSGAQIVLFTTGRGTPFGCPAPTMKISSNTAIAQKKPHWIDFDAGCIAQGTPLDEVAERLYQQVLETASGEQTNTEKHNIRDLAIFKTGVTL